MTTYCQDWLYAGDATYVCLLPEGHPGRHRDDLYEGEGPHPRAAVMTWDQEPATVQGSVIQ